MSEIVTITAQAREKAGKGAARSTRRDGRVPAVIYGSKEAPTLISLDPKEVDREYARRGFFARPLDVEVGGKKQRVLPRDVQKDPVSDRPLHVDFMRISADTRIRVEVPVVFVHDDQSPGLKRGGVLNIVRHEIELICRPESIPASIEINVQEMDIGDSMHIESIQLPEGVTPAIKRNFTIATIAGRSAKADEETAAPTAAAAPEATAQKKEEPKK